MATLRMIVISACIIAALSIVAGCEDAALAPATVQPYADLPPAPDPELYPGRGVLIVYINDTAYRTTPPSWGLPDSAAYEMRLWAGDRWQGSRLLPAHQWVIVGHSEVTATIEVIRRATKDTLRLDTATARHKTYLRFDF